MDNTKLIKAFIISLPITDLMIYFTYLLFDISIELPLRIIMYTILFSLLILNKALSLKQLYIILTAPIVLISITSIINLILGTFDITKVFMYVEFLLLPTIFYIFYIIKDTIKLNELKSSLNIVIMIIFTVFILSTITRTGAATYNPEQLGHSAWFYYGNDISIIISALFIFTFYQFISNSTINSKTVPFIFMTLIPGFMIATKTPVLVFTLCIGIFILYQSVSIAIRENKDTYTTVFLEYIKKVLLILLMFFVSIIISNILLNIYEGSPTILDPGEIVDVPGNSNAEDRFTMFDNFITKLLSGRNLRFADNNVIFSSNLFITIIFGSFETPLLFEMDLFDIFYNFGLVGLFSILLPVWIIVYSVLKNTTNYITNFDKFYFSFTFALGILISTLVGHTFSTPGVSIYIIILVFMSSEKIKNDIPNIPILS